MKKIKRDTEVFFPAIKSAILNFQELFGKYGIQIVPQRTYEFSSTVIAGTTWLSLNYLVYVKNIPSEYWVSLRLSPDGLLVVKMTSNNWLIGAEYRAAETDQISLNDEIELERILYGMADILVFRGDGEIQVNAMQDLFDKKEALLVKSADKIEI